MAIERKYRHTQAQAPIQDSASLARKLVRRFAAQGVPLSLTYNIAGTHMDTGAANVVPGYKAEANGVQVARAVYGGLYR